MFANIDPSVLDDPAFKEDAVREEIIAPLLRRIGYGPSGPTRIQRSKSLSHPFVHIGTRAQSVTVIPDYTLVVDDKPRLILDAKAPTEAILRSRHVEQAYSYAIHPEVRCQQFALCNGRQLVIFDVGQVDPVLLLAFNEFESRWSEIERHLSPAYLRHPTLRDFEPDLGFFAHMLGLDESIDITLPGCRLSMIGRVTDQRYSAGAIMMREGGRFMASFDFRPAMLTPMLSCLAAPLKAQVVDALSRAPFWASTDAMLEVDLVTRLGRVTFGTHEAFVPFLVKNVLASRLNRDKPLKEATDIPEDVFRLRQAFEALRAS